MIAAKLGDKKSAERLVQAKADILIGDKVGDKKSAERLVRPSRYTDWRQGELLS